MDGLLRVDHWPALYSGGVRFLHRGHFSGPVYLCLGPAPPKLLIFSTFMVTISAAASAFFVISVNAWMNQPAGFEMVDGRVVSIDPSRAIFNPAMPYEVTHV